MIIIITHHTLTYIHLHYHHFNLLLFIFIYLLLISLLTVLVHTIIITTAEMVATSLDYDHFFAAVYAAQMTSIVTLRLVLFF